MEVHSARGWGGGRSLSGRSLAIGVSAALLLIMVPSFNMRYPLDSAPQILCCIGAGLVLRRPVLGAGLLGVVLTLLAFLAPLVSLGASLAGFAIAIATWAASGRRLGALLFALWYFVMFIIASSATLESASDMTTMVAIWLVVVFGPLLLGEGIWRQKRRAERQRHEQAAAAELQRHAIARDLHDTLAYATTTMVMKAEQARLRGGQDHQTLADLDFIAATGRSATADLRTLLALLREPEDADNSDGSSAKDHARGVLPPTRFQEVLEGQRRKLEAFGFEVNLALDGDPTCLPDRLSAVLSRVVTELASNITKHGDPACEVNVMIDLNPGSIEAVFISTTGSTRSESGHKGLGLLGLREVVEAVGGSLESGPMGERWISHVTLPRGGGADA